MNIAARHPAGELLDPQAKWPKGWRKVCLADVADMRLGKMLDAQKNKGSLFPYLANPNVRWFDLDLSNLKEMRFEKDEEEKFSLRDGDVLVCEGGEAGRAAIWQGPDSGVKFQKAIHRVRPKEALFNRFLVHRLFYDYQKGNLNDYYTGATIKHLTGQDLARYEFTLPPLDEQKRIAAILDQADTLRRLRQRAIDRLNNLRRAIFHEMFEGPRASANNFAEVKVEALGANQDGVKCGPFGTQLAQSEFTESGVPLWGIKHVNSRFETNTSEYVSQKKFLELKQYDLQPLDIVMTRKGTIGNCAIYPSPFPAGVMHSDLLRLRVNLKEYNPFFLVDYFRYDQKFAHQLNVVSSGAIMQGINVTRLKNLSVWLPRKSQQDEYAERISVLANWRKSNLSSEEAQRRLFSSLQHRAFTGQL